MRYREMRWPCDYPVKLQCGAEEISATIVNVSVGGMRLRVSDPVQVGEVVTLEVGRLRFTGTVRWSRPPMCGLRLPTPLGRTELAVIRRVTPSPETIGGGRWNTHLLDMR